MLSYFKTALRYLCLRKIYTNVRPLTIEHTLLTFFLRCPFNLDSLLECIASWGMRSYNILIGQHNRNYEAKYSYLY